MNQTLEDWANVGVKCLVRAKCWVEWKLNKAKEAFNCCL